MKLSVSNIAWDNKELELHLRLLKDLGCEGVEIAPSCIWREPVKAERSELEYIKRLIKRNSLVISAFHALLFNHPNLFLFGGKTIRDKTVDYLKDLIRLAGYLSVRILIYGSPKSRHIGNIPYNECYGIAVDTFRKLAKEASFHDICFCIEPLGPSETDFIQNAEEGYQLVKDVDRSNFGLHLDTKAMTEAKEDFGNIFKRYGSIIKHFHISEPGLAPPGHADMDHLTIGRYLSDSSYKNFVSIEMKKGYGDTKKVVKSAVMYVRRYYFMER